MEAAIRGALDKAGIPGAQARRRIYDSARSALDRSLERQGISEPQRIDEHRHRLEVLIAEIEAEWAPPEVDETPAAPDAAAVPEASAVAAAPVSAAPVPAAPLASAPVRPEPVGVQPPQPESVAPETAKPVPVAPESREPEQAARQPEPAWPEPASPAATPAQPAPAVEAASRPSAAPAAASHGEASLDIAPGAGKVTAAATPVAAPGLSAERPPHIKPGATKAAKPAKPVKVPKPRKQKRRRHVFASVFSAAVMLSFFGIGIWWLVDSGALKTAEERDTGVPNPPPSLTRDDFAGGPQQLNPDSGFSGEWANVFTPGRDGTPEASSNASAELIEETEANVLRIVSGSGGPEGEVRVPLGAEVMQALAGRQSVLALTVRSASPEATQIYVRCEFSVLGDCGRHRFDVTYDTTDILFNLDYDRALAPNQGGYLVINSDISGNAKGIDLLAVRIKPQS